VVKAELALLAQQLPAGIRMGPDALGRRHADDPAARYDPRSGTGGEGCDPARR